MSESKFTPGSWDLVEIGDKCKRLCPAKDNLSILTVVLEYGDDDGPTYFGAVENEADARLIAAAPDMYEALKELEDSISYWSDYEVPVGIVNRISAAIAKAEGRE